MKQVLLEFQNVRVKSLFAPDLMMSSDRKYGSFRRTEQESSFYMNKFMIA